MTATSWYCGLIEEQVTENERHSALSSCRCRRPVYLRERSKKKTNLMVFLRPVIVRSADDIVGFTQDHYEQMRYHEQSRRWTGI